MTTPELIDWGTIESQAFLEPYLNRYSSLGIEETYNDMMRTAVAVRVADDSSFSEVLVDNPIPEYDVVSENYSSASTSVEKVLPSISYYKTGLFDFL